MAMSIDRISRALEDGAFAASRGPMRALAGAWARVAARSIARPLRAPDGVRVIAVGGATLGGSGKTPVALALAMDEARSDGAHGATTSTVALVGHAYRASPGTARWVSPDDPIALVGDEALACARILARAGSRALVVVAPKRQAAIDFAVREGATALVLDGVAQTSPVRASRAILAVDALAPWGAGMTPPLGDLRAPKDALLAACDEVIAVRDELAREAGAMPHARTAIASSRGVWLADADTLLPWADVRALRVGLATSLARPKRVVAFLARRGVVPVLIASARDHTPVALPEHANVDLWLTTEKCRTHSGAHDAQRLRLAAIDYALSLPS
jgi:tetraacyldisaccharide 4'-kinase